MATVLAAPSSRSDDIVARDGPLVKYDSGLVRDTAAGLEWFPGPDRGLSWAEARNWVSGLSALGGSWRMPSRRELRSLFRIGDGVRNLTPLLANSGYWLWAGQTPSSASRWVFAFSYGGEGWNGQAPTDGGRALAVREYAGR
jgi:hypothetical protein